ncbi:hypothetical protein HGRIS_007584 [Hohenbuehelia grisea]|uniref:RING-type domain-containing protein n=1 Tax=Hohenbuehelia grisea TaxID=104357 RepID=A0ABR3J5P2_9AGAR
MSDDDEYFSQVDDLANVDWDSVPGLAGPSSHPGPLAPAQPVAGPSSQPIEIPRPSSTHSRDSSHYSFGDDLDQATFDALDAIEARISQQDRIAAPTPRVPSASSNLSAPSPYFPPPNSTRSASRQPIVPPIQNHKQPLASQSQKPGHADVLPSRASAKRPASPLESPAQRKKGKMRDDGLGGQTQHHGVQKLLQTFEDEMTCPICCDIFAAAQLGNPCGHSFCGECGWTWIQKQKKSRKATCPVCRARLSGSHPMLPNIAVDNTVQRHIEALHASGQEDWGPNGARMKEWEARKARWKATVAKKDAEEKKKKEKKFQPRVVHSPRFPIPASFELADIMRPDMFNMFGLIVDDDDDDEDYVLEVDD